jgi:hypothetical protein
MSSALEPGEVFAVPMAQKMDDLIDLSSLLSVTTPEGNARTLGAGDTGMPSFIPSDIHVSSTAADTASNPVPEAPFDFLKQHPELIAELSKTDCPIPADDLTVLAEVLTLQRLQELGIDTNGGVGTGASSPPAPVLPAVSTEKEVPVPPPDGSSQPIDYLKLGWSPSQVLAELQRQKGGYGGILPPDKMEPFLDYFGEMSSRELERIESMEEKRKPKKSTPGGRVKRNMAIRFPSQHSEAAAVAAPSKSLPVQEFSTTYDVPVERLPVADMENSNSDSSESSSAVVPLSRSDYIRKFLRGENQPNSIIDPDVLLGVLESEDKDVETGGLGLEENP